MTEQPRPAAIAKPIQNMRVTLWGVQGSCPIFPTPESLQEYSRRLAVSTLTRAVQDMQRKAQDGRCSVEDLLNGPPTAINIEAYQRQIGLPDLPFYGGETTCIQVETSEGNVLVFDAGSGIRRCALQLVKQFDGRPEKTIHLFGSHEHLDHRSGLTFARFCYVREEPFTIHMYGSYQFLRAIDQHYGLFSRQIGDTTYVDDPIDFNYMPAKFVGHEIKRNGNAEDRVRHWEVRQVRPIQIGATTVIPFEVYHGVPCCLAYKVVHNGKSFIFATDHELRHGPDENDPRQQQSREAEARLREHCANADVAYMDGQYLLEEYFGQRGIGSFPPVKRVDWGHGCVEDIVDRAFKCNIRRTFVGHHDPERSWPERHEVDRRLAKLCAGKPNQLKLADGEMVIDL